MQVEPQIPDREVALRLGRQPAVGAVEDRPNPRRELAVAERLGHVVVGAGQEALNDVVVVVARDDDPQHSLGGRRGRVGAVRRSTRHSLACERTV